MQSKITSNMHYLADWPFSLDSSYVEPMTKFEYTKTLAHTKRDPFFSWSSIALTVAVSADTRKKK